MYIIKAFCFDVYAVALTCHRDMEASVKGR